MRISGMLIFTLRWWSRWRVTLLSGAIIAVSAVFCGWLSKSAEPLLIWFVYLLGLGGLLAVQAERSGEGVEITLGAQRMWTLIVHATLIVLATT